MTKRKGIFEALDRNISEADLAAMVAALREKLPRGFLSAAMLATFV